MRSLLQGMGVEFTEKSDDSTTFAFQIDGHIVTLLNQVKSMQLSACVQDHVDPQKANQWNQAHFFTRVGAFNQQGCPPLESDVGFAGGVTNEMIEAFISHFCTDVTIYAKFVTNPQPGSGTPSAAPSPIATMAWSQSGQRVKSSAPSLDATAAPGLPPGLFPGLLKINSNVSLKYDPVLWKQPTPLNDGEFVLLHSPGDAHALVIAERTAVPLDSMEDIALANAQAADPEAKVIFRNKLRVNGTVLHFLKIEAGIDTVPTVFCGYYYAGENGTVQIVTYAAKSLFPQYEAEFMDFLNGLVVAK